MRVERISTGVVSSQKTQSNNIKNCSPIRTQNEGDAFVSKKNVSFGNTDGMFGGGLLGWALCAIGTVALAPVTAPMLAVAAAATVAGAAGGAAGGYIGDKLTGEDK